MQTAARMWQMFREIKCKKKNCVESSETLKALQSGTSGRVKLRRTSLHVELCDTSSGFKITPTLKASITGRASSLIFVHLMTGLTDIGCVKDAEITEVVNNTIIMRNARNNMNKLTWSISLIITSDGHIKADVLRLPTIQQPINAKHDRVEAICNMALEK